MAPEIHVSPTKSNFIEDLDEFKITGLTSGNIFRVELTLQHKSKFIAYAYFKSDEDGVVDLARDAPHWGYYEGVDKMGLFTSLYQDPTERFATKLNLTPVPDSLNFTITVHVLENPKSIAETVIERVVRHPDVVREELVHDDLEGVVFYPKKRGDNIPCIIDLSGVGGNKEYRACFLAAQGYYVLSLALYGKSPKLPKRHEDVNTEYLVYAVDYITSLPFTTDHCAVIGTSLGGTWSFHTATRNPKVKAALNINGQGAYYFVSQINEEGLTLPWTPVSEEAMAKIEIINGCQAYAKMYGTCKAEEKHLIPLEKLESHQNIFYIASEWDQAIDAIQQGERIKERMSKAGKEQQFKLEVAKKGCHVIDPPFMPICDVAYVGGKFLMFGGDKYVSGCEQRRLWPVLLEFLADNLGKPSSV